MSLWLVLPPVLLQAIAMLVDEAVFHRHRGLPRWERIGHPLDTLTVVLAFAWLALVDPRAPYALAGYVALSAFSCLFVTKDEMVHARHCDGAEHWLHSLLFVLHPVVLFIFGYAWQKGACAGMIRAQLVMLVLFGIYQAVYWSSPWAKKRDAR